MKTYTKKEINYLIKRLENRTLPKMEWSHEAHLVVAIWYCFNYDFDSALNSFRRIVKKYNESVGTHNTDSGGYHETITKFWFLVANKFLKNQESKSISEICNAFINADEGKRNYPMNFYSKPHLFSVRARRNWLEPDLNKLNKSAVKELL